MTRRVKLSAAEARRIALAAQGFDRGRPASCPDSRHFRRILDLLGLLQIDFVNVLLPAHYLMIWSRIGAYDRQRFDHFIYESGGFTEQCAHEASIVPVSAWPLLAHRRAAWQPSKRNPVLKLPNRRRYLDRVIEQVRSDGALCANELPPVPGPKRKVGDWHRSVPRWALEYHFSRGALTVKKRKPNFQRIYDLPERVIPNRYLEQNLCVEDAQRALLQLAADAFGVATLHDLADYYRMSAKDAAPRLAELLEAGELRTVAIENWEEPAYLSARARIPRQIEGASLLSPFDPVVWFRPRAKRLFDFHYRIEIYLPEAKRKYGYYVLPFRLGDDIVARVDLKADRKSGRLLVQHAHLEDGRDAIQCAVGLADELKALGNWLGLQDVSVRRRGEFAKQLQKQICQTQAA